MKQTLWRLALGLTAVSILAACGGGGDDASTSSAAAPEAAAPVEVAAAGSGSVAGRVNFTGEDTDAEISMDADPVCAGLHSESVSTETIVANDGGLANVFVYVKEGAGGGHAVPAEPVVLDQVGCTYVPHVAGIQVGQKLVIRNSDSTLHNVHAMPEANDEFNQGQPFQNMELEKTFDIAEVMVRFKCDVHPWMGAYMGVVDNPFYTVSGADGSFSIEGLAAGDYVLEAWHETLGTRTVNVTVGDGAAEAAFDYDA